MNVEALKLAIGRVRKAIAVALAGVIVLGLGKAGVITDVDTIETIVTFAIASASVYFVPNSKRYF